MSVNKEKEKDQQQKRPDDNIGPLDDKFEAITEGATEEVSEEDVATCKMNCLVRFSTLEGHIKINDTLKELKSYFFDHKLVKIHLRVKDLEEELVKLCSTEFRYEFCPKISGCPFILHDLKLHREVLRALMCSAQSPETLTDNRLIWMLDYAEGLRANTFVRELNPKSNARFTDLIEQVRKHIYILYKTYENRATSPREQRLFTEGARIIELDINRIAGHIVAAGMRRREEMNKWGIVSKDSRKYLRAAVAQGAKVGGFRSGEPATLRSVAEGDPTFASMDLNKFSEMRRQEELKRTAQTEGQLDQIKDTEFLRERVRDMREDKREETRSPFQKSPKQKPDNQSNQSDKE